MNVKNLLKRGVAAVKRNPQLMLAIGMLVAPKLVRKVVPVVLAVGDEAE